MSGADGSLTGQYLDFLHSRTGALRSEEVQEAVRLHLLDATAAIVSGRSLAAGRAAAKWLARHGRGGSCSCVGMQMRYDAEDAVLMNAMCAHADESDDSHEPSRSHPGASVVPVVLALAEECAAGADAIAEAIGVGYEACALMNWLIWGAQTLRGHPGSSTHAYGGLWGSAMAAGWMLGFDDRQLRSLISYAADVAAGPRTWLRDKHHVEKAFVFAGMPASNSVRMARLVAAGWPGVVDALDGSPSFFSTFEREADNRAFEYAASQHPVILDTNIKKYCVGSPAQAAVQAAEELAQEGMACSEVVAVRCFLPAELALVVDNREMQDINVQYLVAATLTDGACSFATAHDTHYLQRPDIAALARLIKLAADREMPPTRQARVEVDFADGRKRSKVASAIRGTSQNPMTRSEVEAKADDLLSRGLGAEQRINVIRACRRLDESSVGQISQALRSVSAESHIG